ncbi:uncharacterized protein LAESUDRAFT_711277 [Laetiporus sulphureus 93-53]|uniref:Uncharacterized protein n=1 Tax=Laetiporus sulphureus 93-53 TaxID=1314785 RepID=A0A165GUP5_9APHY|nr:uncharacterized protein LAESUDRAFT_711277 [Laetiporus sulphureus 93-53]KZT10836.1 hypothetical protein LAESUDRAFT_711277 [Laetiporus sulphureus 93-53]
MSANNIYACRFGHQPTAMRLVEMRPVPNFELADNLLRTSRTTLAVISLPRSDILYRWLTLFVTSSLLVPAFASIPTVHELTAAKPRQNTLLLCHTTSPVPIPLPSSHPSPHPPPLIGPCEPVPCHGNGPVAPRPSQQHCPPTPHLAHHHSLGSWVALAVTRPPQ